MVFWRCAGGFVPRGKSRSVIVSVLVALAFFLCVHSGFSEPAPATSTLSGSVKSSDGKPLEGVGVSARGRSENFTTTVYTDESGRYLFPPMDIGQYRVWAQAVGFEVSRAEADLSDGAKKHVELTLTNLADFHKQLSGTEWAASLPEDTPEDRRMKAVFINNCSGCHQVSFLLQNRFDAAGWGAVITLMEKMLSIGYAPVDATPNPVIHAYKQELAEYLGRVRGPGNSPLNLKLLPRPTGESAQIVVTEYDLSRPDLPGWVMEHNGTDWSEGTPSRWNGRAAHDVAIDKGGSVWFADDATPERTLGKLDPRTGRITEYKLADEANAAESSHALVFDQAGNLWFANGTEGSPTKFDPETGKFFRFPRPQDFPFSGDFITLDTKGNVWSPHREGAFKLDPLTGKYTNYSARPGKANYDLAADEEDKVWVSKPGGNNMEIVDSHTGKIEELALNSIVSQDYEATAKDRELSASLGLTPNTATPLEKGPRRSVADRGNDVIWVCEFFADRLAKIDARTKKVTEYPLPHRFSQPYAATVNTKDHMVWITMLNSDRIAKFDPSTEKFTEYVLPTRGTEIRHIQVDSSTSPPTVWLPYDRTNKIARVQFR
ncbi:MAG TPA: carboxypeptidase regulatory-like domain-containing protein [Candidatus Acidoferrales bacterium]|nr:carboxypeptidase regulatory-like domain-containing protein [Candidatus Acidoferrales bacterium]